MQIYWQVARRAFRRWSTYRAASMAGAFTNTVFGLIQVAILLAVYARRDSVGGFDVTDALTFTFLTQAFIAPIEMFGGDSGLGERIRTGEIVTDLYRPVDVQGYFLASDLGRAAFAVLARGLPPLLVGGALFHLRMPDDPVVMVAFAVSAVVAVLVSFFVRFIVGMSAFWILDSRGTVSVMSVLTWFFSGSVLPLVFFPGWLEGVSRLLPFASMLQVPGEIFLGKHGGADLAVALAGQVAWAAALCGAGRVILAAATRRLVVHGG